MSERHLHGLTISEASQLIHTKQISPVELTLACLQRIDSLDDRIQAWVTVVHEEALEKARKAEFAIMKGMDLGPLHGIPYGAKDIFCTAHIRTSAGSKVDPEFIPDQDATVISRLNNAGAILLGKTATTEYAFKGGPPSTRNPWNLAHTPGGSSSGSGAALAASMAFFTLGTQTIGSLLRPAAYNGLTCLKSSYGRVSRHGVIPVSWSLDHVGAFTKTAEDSAIVLQIMAGYDPLDPDSLSNPIPDFMGTLGKSIKDTVIGIPTSFFHTEDEDAVSAMEAAIDVFRELGVRFQPVKLPELLDEAITALDTVMLAEAGDYHKDNFERVPDKYGPYLREQLEAGYAITAVDYFRAQRTRTLFRQELVNSFDEVDFLLTPSTPTLAPAGILSTGSPLFNGPFTNAGIPAINIPVGFASSTGLPIGVQLAARPLADGDLLKLAYQFQQVTEWHKQYPRLENV